MSQQGSIILQGRHSLRRTTYALSGNLWSRTDILAGDAPLEELYNFTVQCKPMIPMYNRNNFFVLGQKEFPATGYWPNTDYVEIN